MSIATDPVLHHLTWTDVHERVSDLAGLLEPGGFDGVWGVPRGGCVPALMLSDALGLPLLDQPGPRTLVVDDLVDSGATLRSWSARHQFVALYRKAHAPQLIGSVELPHGWVVFPWEGVDEQAGPTDAVVRLLELVGEDPNRPGLVDTPGRVVRALAEMTEGYRMDPAVILERVFDEPSSDEMVVVDGIDFTSLCEHHLLPFAGTAVVGYVPQGGKVVGLSKIPRLVECFARRLQVQERLTRQIADAMDTHLAPAGVGVVLRAKHSCMGCRGVRKPAASMVTSATLGLFRDDPRARAEFLALAR